MKKIFENVMKLSLAMFVLIQINVASATDTSAAEGMGFQYVEFDGQQVPVGGTVTMDDATKYVEEKGYALIGGMQKVAKPITLVVMVACGLMAVVSGLTGGSKNGGSGRWIWAAIVSAICYVGVVFSPVILELIVNFMKPY